MALHTPISHLLTPLLASFRTLTLTHTMPPTSLRTALLPFSKHKRAFSTTSPRLAHVPNNLSKNRKKPKTVSDQRLALIRYHMQHPLTPRPLRFSRMRALRHWTIHRAWMLARRKKLEMQEGELMRQYQSIHSACEALRNLDPPTTKDAGRLYRIAMEKKGLFGHGGVPIEYARFQVDTPAKEPWNHGWTR